METAYKFDVTRATTIAELRTLLAVGGNSEPLQQLDALLEIIIARIDGKTRDDVMGLPAMELAVLAQGALDAVLTSVGSPVRAIAKALAAKGN